MASISNAFTPARLIKIDQYADYVPFVSTATNLVDLFQKCVLIPRMKPEEIEQSRYYTYLQDKSVMRCITLLVPLFGNGVIILHRCYVEICLLIKEGNRLEKLLHKTTEKLSKQLLIRLKLDHSSFYKIPAKFKTDPDFMVKALKILLDHHSVHFEWYSYSFEKIADRNPDFYIQYFNQMILPGIQGRIKPELLDVFKKCIESFIQKKASSLLDPKDSVKMLLDYTASDKMNAFFKTVISPIAVSA